MNRFIRSLLGILTITISGIPAEAAGSAPRLVVGIHIDQLKSEYLEWFMDGFSEDGFKKILQNGLVYKSLRYSYPKPDAASASASIECGSNPESDGIISSKWYDRNKDMVVSCVFDPSYLGNYTLNSCSPKNLIPSTIGDELKIATKGESKVYSIGISAESAIISGGHLADGVYWIDDNTGKWCSTTYYNDIPRWLQQVNDDRDIDGIIEKTDWAPLYPLDFYKYMPYEDSPTLFSYWLSKYGKDKVSVFRESPMANSEVCSLAIEAIDKEKLGKDETPDYLVINLTATENTGISKSLSAVEKQDIYFRLDQEIGKVVDAVERQAGLGNALIYIVGTGEPQEEAPDIAKKYSVGGDFYPKRCTSLLNLYLMAIYGNENWVSTWQNNQVYLNRSLIEKKGINYEEISYKAARFLGEFSGVKKVIRNCDLITGKYDSALEKYRKGLFNERSGDFYIELQPGWNIRKVENERDLQVRYGNFQPILAFYGFNVKPQKISLPVQAEDIAPTICKVFRIRPPNSSEGYVLKEMDK